MDDEIGRFLDMYADLTRAPFEPPPHKELVEHEGRFLDPDTGLDKGPVFVTAFRAEKRRFFSRYSRQSRFMSEVMARYTDNKLIYRILKLFESVLKRWKATRHTLDRIYFLNVKCVLFLIAEHLDIQRPFPKSECLRDLRRFERQKELFEKFV